MPISLHWPAQLNAWMRAWNHWITEQPFLPVMRLSRDFLPWATKSQAIDPAFRLSRAGKSLCHRGKKCTFWYTGSFLSHRPAAVHFRYAKQCSPVNIKLIIDPVVHTSWKRCSRHLESIQGLVQAANVLHYILLPPHITLFLSIMIQDAPATNLCTWSYFWCKLDGCIRTAPCETVSSLLRAASTCMCLCYRWLFCRCRGIGGCH